jgi:hypothetical protein
MNWLGEDQEIFFDSMMVVDRQGLTSPNDWVPMGKRPGRCESQNPPHAPRQILVSPQHLVQDGMMPSARLEFELLTNGTPAKPWRVLFPRLGL